MIICSERQLRSLSLSCVPGPFVPSPRHLSVPRRDADCGVLVSSRANAAVANFVTVRLAGEFRVACISSLTSLALRT